MKIIGIAGEDLVLGESCHYYGPDEKFYSITHATKGGLVDVMALQDLATDEEGPFAPYGLSGFPISGGGLERHALFIDEATGLPRSGGGISTTLDRTLLGFLVGRNNVNGEYVDLWHAPPTLLSLFPYATSQSGAGASNAFRFGMAGTDLANGSSGNVRYTFIIPCGVKALSACRVRFYWTSTVTGGNVVFNYDSRLHNTGATDGFFNNTAGTSAGNVVAANASANEMMITLALGGANTGTLGLATNGPRWRSIFSIEITRDGAHASDTNTGIVFIAGAELELINK